jgi:hypothetical protein
MGGVVGYKGESEAHGGYIYIYTYIYNVRKSEIGSPYNS